jgi:hypothetical protein
MENFPKLGLMFALAVAFGCTTSAAQRDDAAVGTGGGASGGESGSGGSGGGSGGAEGAASGGTSPLGSGGARATGGSPGAGGVAATGGSRGSGGAPGTGGATASGGAKGTGGASATGGATAAGGASGACKRGVATNTAPGAAFFPAVRWWYDWSNQGGGASTGIEFVPMIWGSASVNSAIPSASKFLLTFNEPNFHAQSNLTAAQAASYWPTLQAKAMAAGNIPIVSPGMNFCGPDSACNGTSPYQYLKDFFAACAGCQVDYVAVHWYNCDLPSLKDYLEPGGSLEGFEQFGKPIWLTEFSCDGSASAADQEAFMRVAVPYLESKANVFRYSWFSASNIPNGQLVNSDGSPTALGQVYLGLPGSCP